jgi:NAD(P)-dependent dehydrogenase (short-subunit alcohol dehydrogenase family)
MNDSPDVFALAKGLCVLVTAGASGIGRAISDLLALRGARVRICDVSDDFLANYRAAHRDSSVTKADVARLFADVTASLGGLDALINNAGMAGPTGGVEDIAPADWRRMAAGGGAIVNFYPQTTDAARVGRAASLLRSAGHAPRGLPEPRFAG